MSFTRLLARYLLLLGRRQDRNSHNYIADLDSESPLYTRAGRLLEQLWEWPLTAPSLAGRIEQLWVHMYEHGYLGE